MRNKVSNIVWGLIFIIFGLGIAGDVMDIWEFNPFFDGWWTLFIIIPCLVSIIQKGADIGSIIGLIIGVLLLASHYIELSFSIWKLTIPIILILVGLRIIFQGIFQPFRINRNNHTSTGNQNEYVAIFSENRVNFTDQFTGTNLNAIFGRLVLDLREAIITGDVEIFATAMFGGIDIYIPSNVGIKINNVPIFGGVSNKTNHKTVPGEPVIYLNSTCVFGGIDIK